MAKGFQTVDLIDKGKIFNPQAKIVVNLERVMEYFETGNTSPVLVEVDPSNVCNHSCSFCISGYIHLGGSKGLPTFNRSIMSRDMLLNLCQDLIDLDTRAINWTGGGEPTVNPALKEAIRFVAENSSIKMGLFTNGTLIDKFNLWDVLVDNLSWVRISIDAGKPRTYNRIRGVGIGNGWDRMISNLNTLIEAREDRHSDMKIGVGFIITPDNYREMIDFAKYFADVDVDYCQYKPEIVNREREGGVQRSLDFWKNAVEKPLMEVKNILGGKFQMNEYKLSDLENDTEYYGRTYRKCLASRIQPCIGADGYVYVCANHRGYREYSYGSLHERSFKDIWDDVETRNRVMNRINNVDKFCNCTKLCKAHESNKMMWYIYNNRENREEIDRLFKMRDELKGKIKHAEFI